MLSEDEFSAASELYRGGIRATKEFRLKYGLPLKQANHEQRFRPLFDYYERVTGFRETNPGAVMHHRIAQYGPPCVNCGKPLRTPSAKLCGSCMFPVAES